MKHRLIVLLGLISCLLQSAYAESVTYSDALNIVEKDFAGKDVDIYKLDAHLMSINWTFFVDAEPLKGWEHQCYVYKIKKNPPTGTSFAPYTKTEMKMPPEGVLTPAHVKNRYGLHQNDKPYVSSLGNASYNLEVANKTHAVIINTGGSKNANYERYWNDCSFIYQTLRKRYQVPKNQIYVAMADGTDPAEDMLGVDGTYKSSPLDLDFDGLADITHAATLGNIKNILSKFRKFKEKNEHLLIFIVGPSGYTGYNGSEEREDAYLNLWNGEKFYRDNFASFVNPIAAGLASVSVFMDINAGGMFLDVLKNKGMIVTSSSFKYYPSWGCLYLPFDEFAYQWTCAMNGATHKGESVIADIDNNGRITMLEAFNYAKKHDGRTGYQRIPTYKCSTTSLGEDLAFNFIPETVDLYIKDNPNDTGKERNLTSDVFWYSPDMWVRNKHDWGTEHQNPECVDFGSSCVVYTRVRNRGRETYTGGKWLHVYWSKSATAITNRAWAGRELYNNKIITGERLRPGSIPGPIPPGGDTIVPISWALPLDMIGTENDNWTEKHHFCLLGKIEDNDSVTISISDVRTIDITGQNDVAQLNVSIISHKEAVAGTAVFVRNVMKGEKEYSLEVRPKVAADAAIFTDANVDLWLSRKIYSGWSKGGLRSNNVRTYHSGDSARVRLLSKESRLESVFMNDSEFDKVTMKLNFVKIPTTQKTYTFDLIQRDGDGNIVGGETFIVKSPEVSTNLMQIETESTGNGNYELTAEISGGDYEKIWYDADGLEIGRGDNITVKPTREANEYSVTALSANGEMARESVTLAPELGIKTITPAASVGDNLGVTLYNEAPANSAVCVSSVNTGTTMVTESVGAGETSVEVDTSSLPIGLYVVTYTEDGNIVDSKRFDKK